MQILKKIIIKQKMKSVISAISEKSMSKNSALI